MNGSLYTWSSINSYFASYLKHNGQNVTTQDLYFLMPSIFLVQYIFMTPGVILGDKIGPRLTTVIGVILMIGSYGILIFFKNYFLVLVGMGVFGMGDGLANLSVIKNAWKYYPNRHGLVNGIIIGGLGISSSILNPIADFVINPKQIKADPKTGLYSKDVANRLPYFLYIMVGIFTVLGLTAIILTFPYKEKDPEEEVITETIQEESDKTMSTKNALLSFKNLQLGATCFCGPCIYIYI